MFTKESTGWPALREMLDTMIEDGRTQLEAQADVAQTDFQRGRIASLRDLIAKIEGDPTPTKPPRY